MSNYQFQQILAMAAAGYPDVLAVVAEMLRKYAATLGLMVPGIPDQLGDMFRSPMAFGKAIQEAIDATCYANCVPPLVLLRVQQLPGGFVGLTLTLGSW